jgi:hypothetical protein
VDTSIGHGDAAQPPSSVEYVQQLKAKEKKIHGMLGAGNRFEIGTATSAEEIVGRYRSAASP